MKKYVFYFTEKTIWTSWPTQYKQTHRENKLTILREKGVW